MLLRPGLGPANFVSGEISDPGPGRGGNLPVCLQAAKPSDSDFSAMLAEQRKSTEKYLDLHVLPESSICLHRRPSHVAALTRAGWLLPGADGKGGGANPRKSTLVLLPQSLSSLRDLLLCQPSWRCVPRPGPPLLADAHCRHAAALAKPRPPTPKRIRAVSCSDPGLNFRPSTSSLRLPDLGSCPEAPLFPRLLTRKLNE